MQESYAILSCSYSVPEPRSSNQVSGTSPGYGNSNGWHGTGGREVGQKGSGGVVRGSTGFDDVHGDRKGIRQGGDGDGGLSGSDSGRETDEEDTILLLERVHLTVTQLTDRLGVLHGSMDTINDRLVRVEASGAGAGAGTGGLPGGGVFAGGTGGGEGKNLDLDMEGF